MNDMRYICSLFGILLLVAVLSGCAVNAFRPAIDRKIGAEPQYNTVIKAEIGESIYSEFDYPVSPKAIILESVIIHNNELVKNSELESVLINGGLCFCVPYNPITSWFPCFRDINNDGIFDEYTKLSNPLDNAFKRMESKVKYKKTSGPLYAHLRLNTAHTGFKKELIYQGVSEGNITIAYREFRNDMARPAYSQIVSYDIDDLGRATIGFKGARIKVYSASGIHIEYEVTKGFK